MRCGACASKLSSAVLSQGLKFLMKNNDNTDSTSSENNKGKNEPESAENSAKKDREKNPQTKFDVVLEKSVGDDCAILRINDTVKSLHTVDFFKAGVLEMDPYVFGQIAAIHSISDIFAMGIGGTPSAKSSRSDTVTSKITEQAFFITRAKKLNFLIKFGVNVSIYGYILKSYCHSHSK